jgi:hypothetical protein
MAISWYVCRYGKKLVRGIVGRYCLMDDFTPQIFTAGGTWSEIEVLGGYYLVKVRAPDVVLDLIAATPGFARISLTRLDDSLTALTQVQRNALVNLATNMGYTTDEIAALGNLRTRTLRQILQFMAGRRRIARYDAFAEDFAFDGSVRACGKTIEECDTEVPELP